MPILASPRTVGVDVVAQVAALTVEIGRLAALVESLQTPAERAELARLRTFYTTIRALYYAGGTISRTKVRDALNAVTHP